MIKSFLRVFFFLTLILLVPLILSGCFPTIGPSDSPQTLESEFLKGSVSEKFPKVPFYPKAEIIESYKSGENFGASAVSKDSLEKVLEFYRQAFVQLGWENSLTRQSTNNYLFEFKNAQLRGSVIVNVASDNKRTAITIAVSPR